MKMGIMTAIILLAASMAMTGCGSLPRKAVPVPMANHIMPPAAAEVVMAERNEADNETAPSTEAPAAPETTTTASTTSTTKAAAATTTSAAATTTTAATTSATAETTTTESTTAAPTIQNPILNHIGRYECGSIRMGVFVQEDGAAGFIITMPTSPFDTAVWTMSGTAVVEGDHVVVTYQDCTKELCSYTADGTLNESTVAYTYGTGSVSFDINECGVVWSDAQEGIADRLVFTYEAD